MVAVRPPASDNEKRRDDAILLLPLFGAVFLLPVFINLFNHHSLLFGLPLEVIYLLSVWFALVLGAFILSRRLKARSLPRSDDSGDGAYKAKAE